MAYIGREPLGGEVILINSIESQFNGVLTTFNLTRTVNGVTSAFYPISTEQLLVSLGGVIQRPDTTGDIGFKIAFNTIIFAVAPVAGTSCFIVAYGNITDIGSPANNTVTTEKLVDGSVTPIKLSTGGPWWLSNGNVGIGTTNPGAKLQVRGSDTIISALVTSGNYGSIGITSEEGSDLQLGYAKNSSNYGAQTIAGDFSIKTTAPRLHFPVGSGNANSIMVLKSDGNVGIGTTNPDVKLDVFGIIKTSGAGSYISLNNNGYIRGDATGELRFQGGNSGTTFYSAGNSIEFLRINNSGNVGIGTTNPATKLSIYSSGTLASFSSSGTYGDILLTNTYAGGTVHYIGCYDSSLRFYANSGSVPTMTISGGSPGNVGIATTNPTHKLDVNGSIRAISYGSLGDYSALLGQIRVGGDQYGNTIKVVNDTNLNIIANNNIYFNTGAATDGSNTGAYVGYFGSNGLYMAPGKGIDFSANSNAAGMTSEVLNDYEEGTWTPRISGTGGGDYTPGGSNVGRYVKVGNVVTASATVHWTGVVTNYSGLLTITGLPFSALNVTNYRGAGIIPGHSDAIYGDATYPILAVGIDWGNAFVYIVKKSDTTGSYSHFPVVNSSGHIYGFTITYITN